MFVTLFSMKIFLSHAEINLMKSLIGLLIGLVFFGGVPVYGNLRDPDKEQRKLEKEAQRDFAQYEKEETRRVRSSVKKMLPAVPNATLSRQEAADVDALKQLVAQCRAAGGGSVLGKSSPGFKSVQQGVSALLRNSDQFLRFSPENQMKVMQELADVHEIRILPDGIRSDTDIRVSWKRKNSGVGGMIDIVCFDPKFGYARFMCNGFLGEEHQILGEFLRTPAIDSRTGKPYLSVPNALLKNLSADDRKYVSFFVYSLNDAVHYWFGTPFPQRDMNTWCAGYYWRKNFPVKQGLSWSCDFNPARPPAAASMNMRESVVKPHEKALSEKFPIQKAVFDDITEYFRNELSATVASYPKKPEKKFISVGTGSSGNVYVSASCPLIPLWGNFDKNSTFRHTGMSIRTIEEEILFPDGYFFEVDEALTFLEALKAMREYLIARDYSTPQRAKSPKGKAMLALFSAQKALEVNLAKEILKNTRLRVAESERVLARTELGPISVSESVLYKYRYQPWEIYFGQTFNLWTLLDPKGKTREQYESRRREHEAKNPPVLCNEPMILEGILREEKAAKKSPSPDEAVQKKMKQMRVAVSLKNASFTLEEAVDFLRKLSKNVDPEGHGINIVIAEGTPQNVRKARCVFNSGTKDGPFTDALRMMLNGFRCVYEIRNGVVEVRPRSGWKAVCGNKKTANPDADEALRKKIEQMRVDVCLNKGSWNLFEAVGFLAYLTKRADPTGRGIDIVIVGVSIDECRTKHTTGHVLEQFFTDVLRVVLGSFQCTYEIRNGVIEVHSCSEK